ncbi:MAG: hypothetical protein ACFFE5_10225 [Candidatus Thorarchaeota archaeon]
MGEAAKITRGKKKEELRPPPSKFDSIATEVNPSGYPPSKKPGRIKYYDIPQSEESSDAATKSEKIIPSNLRHRNR